MFPGFSGIYQILPDTPGYPIVELEGIEPSSVRRLPDPLRPFPSFWLTAASSPGRVGHEDPTAGAFPGVSGLCRLSVVSPTVHHRFW